MTVGPLSAGDFAALMARLEPFEPAPRLAVAVSGGADSLALALLCHHWARTRGGSVLALTVDHRLRPESDEEAATVGAHLAALGIAHEVLHWDGAKPAAGIQAAAREARYRLLVERAAATGIFHLLLGHHREDQAETLLLRLAHGSGPDGLAAMAAIRELPELRLLRPLLTVPKAALAATCAAAGLAWVEDPSNRSPAYARARLRAVGGALAREGLSSERLAASARRLGQARAALDAATAALLARAVTLHDAGFLTLDPARLAAAPEEIGRRALARCLATIGGAPAPPRSDRLDRLCAEIAAGIDGGRTLAGCRVVPAAGGRLLVVREARAAAAPLPLAPGETVWWDRRFQLRLAQGPDGLRVCALGAAGWREVAAHVSPASRAAIPEPARAALPALVDRRGVAAVPHLGFARGGGGFTENGGAAGDAATVRPDHPIVATTRFLPASPLAGADFAVA